MRKRVGAFLLGATWTFSALGDACAQSMEARQVMEATNDDRAQRGLGPLKWDPHRSIILWIRFDPADGQHRAIGSSAGSITAYTTFAAADPKPSGQATY